MRHSHFQLRLQVRVELVLLMLIIQATAQVPTPRKQLTFEEFRVLEIFHGRPAEPVLNTSFARLFRTRIQGAAKKGPNFAGKFTIAHWGCGTTCISIAIINEESGSVYGGPFRFLDYDGSIRYPDGSSWPFGNLDPFLTRWTVDYLWYEGVPIVSLSAAALSSIMNGE